MKGRIYSKSEDFVGGDGNKESKSDKGEIIGAVGQVAGTIITSLGTVRDAKLRREYEQRISQLDAQEQKALNSKLLKAQSDAERRKVFADLLAQSNKSRIESGVPKNLEIGLWVFGGIIILGTTYYILKKFNK